LRFSTFIAVLLFASCGSDQVLTYDLEPIEVLRAPTQPGGPALGGLMAKVTTPNGIESLLVDSAYPLNSLARNGCPATPGWTYTGDIELRAGNATAPVRAWFRHVGLFDICPGSTGDAASQAVGVIGGPLLASFAVGLNLPRSAEKAATMTLWWGFPGSDDQLAQDGYAPLHFVARGGAAIAQGSGEASVVLPSARIVLSACAAPRAFLTSEPVETCAPGEVATKASGQDLMLALGTGEGPLILSQSAWNRIAAQLGMASDASTAGDLYTPFSTAPTPAHFLTLPRLAIFQGTSDSNWNGACVELARARRIEWALANQASGACFQHCDVSSGKAVNSHSYIELGPALDLAVVDGSSELLRSLNVDSPPNPQVDGIIGAATLAGTRLRLDYAAKPQGRVIVDCETGSMPEQCRTAPSCQAGWPAKAEGHSCFGQPEPVPSWPPVCP
jgi:hypothetical protein